MKITEVIKVLEDHNVWRRGSDTAQTDPKQLTEALETAIKTLKRRRLLKLRLISFFVAYIIWMSVLFTIQHFYKPVDWVWVSFGAFIVIILKIRYEFLYDKNDQNLDKK